MIICLERGADLHIAQLMPLLLTVSCFSKIQIGFLPFWYQLTRVVLQAELTAAVWIMPDMQIIISAVTASVLL